MGCTGCLKNLLFIFNFALWLLGCALLSVGIWLKLDDSAHHEVQQITEKVDEEYQIKYNAVDTDDSTATFAYILIVFGVVIILVTFIGCCGAVRENICFLGAFAICLFVVMCALIGVGIWANYKKDNVVVHTLELKTKTDTNVMKAIDKYYDHTPSQEFMDMLHKKFHCCGGLRSELDFKKRVPTTCLETYYRRRCTDFYFRYVGDEIEDFLEHRYSVLVGICIGFGICTGIGLALTLLLCCVVRKNSSARVS